MPEFCEILPMFEEGYQYCCFCRLCYTDNMAHHMLTINHFHQSSQIKV